MKNGMRPVHTGQILRYECLEALGMNAQDVASALRIPAARLQEIVEGKRKVTPDTALHLAHCFGSNAQTWTNLQTTYDLKVFKPEHGEAIEREVLVPERETE